MNLNISEESTSAEVGNSPLIGNRCSPVTTSTVSKTVEAATSPVRTPRATATEPWPSQCDEDIDRLVAMHQNRSSLSSLGVSIIHFEHVHRSLLVLK